MAVAKQSWNDDEVFLGVEKLVIANQPKIVGDDCEGSLERDLHVVRVTEHLRPEYQVG